MQKEPELTTKPNQGGLVPHPSPYTQKDVNVLGVNLEQKIFKFACSFYTVLMQKFSDGKIRVLRMISKPDGPNRLPTALHNLFCVRAAAILRDAERSQSPA